MLLEIGIQVDILLRNGQWIKKNMTVVSLLNGAIKLQTLQGQQKTYDPHKDVAVMVKSSLIQL